MRNEDLHRKITELARSYALEAIDTLIDILRNSPKGSDRVQAAKIILDRGYGKASSFLKLEQEVSGSILPIVNVSIAKRYEE